jgi:uncharacterized protein
VGAVVEREHDPVSVRKPAGDVECRGGAGRYGREQMADHERMIADRGAPGWDGAGVVLQIRVKPRAPRRRIVGERAGRLLVEVTEPPIKGRANDALCRLLADALRIAPGRIAVQSGGRARDKLVRIDGLELAVVCQRLQPAAKTPPNIAPGTATKTAANTAAETASQATSTNR